MATKKLFWHQGGCHCQSVRFEVNLPEVIEAQTCNCSVCSMTGFLHIIVPESRFRILKGKENLTEYTFNTGVAKHFFCKACGIKSFYKPRSNPDGWSINAHCVDGFEKLRLSISDFDGENWEANSSTLAYLSKEI